MHSNQRVFGPQTASNLKQFQSYPNFSNSSAYFSY